MADIDVFQQQGEGQEQQQQEQQQGQHRNYKISKRELSKRTIRNLMTSQRMSAAEIAEHLNISQRTAERYIADILAKDRELFMRPAIEEVAERIAEFRQKLSWSEQDLVRRLRTHPDLEMMDVIAAHELLTKIGWAHVKLSYVTPAEIVRHTTSLDQVLGIMS